MPTEFVMNNLHLGIEWIKRTCGVSWDALKARFDTLGLQSLYQMAATRNDSDRSEVVSDV